MERPLWDLARTVHWELSRSTAPLSLTVQPLPTQFQQRSKHSIWSCVLQLKSKISLGKVCERSERSERKVNTRGFYLELSKHSGKVVNNTNISMANLRIKSKKKKSCQPQTDPPEILPSSHRSNPRMHICFWNIWSHLDRTFVWYYCPEMEMFSLFGLFPNPFFFFLVFRTQKWFTLEMSNLIQCLLGKETCLWSLLEGLGG